MIQIEPKLHFSIHLKLNVLQDILVSGLVNAEKEERKAKESEAQVVAHCPKEGGDKILISLGLS